MMRFNMRVGPVRKQMTNMQNMNNYEMSMQNMNNLQVFSFEERKPKGINKEESLSHVCSTDESEWKIVIVNACYFDDIK